MTLSWPNDVHHDLSFLVHPKNGAHIFVVGSALILVDLPIYYGSISWQLGNDVPVQLSEAILTIIGKVMPWVN